MDFRRYVHGQTITPGTPVQASDGAVIVATVAGTIGLKLVSGFVLPVSVDLGTSIFDDLCVVDVVAGGATATVTALYRHLG